MSFSRGLTVHEIRALQSNGNLKLWHSHTLIAVGRLDLDIDLRTTGNGRQHVDRIILLHAERLWRVSVLDADIAKQEAHRVGLLADALQVRVEYLFEGRPLSDLEKHCEVYAAAAAKCQK